MPTYDYRCESCDIVEEHRHLMSEDPQIKCSDCGSLMKKQISLSCGGIIFKGGTPEIHDREKRMRKRRSEQLAVKQRQKYGDLSPEVTPNIAGVRQESWSDCQKLAKECGLNADSYKPMVEKEKKKKKGIIV